MYNSGNPGKKSLIDYRLINKEHDGNVISFIIEEGARYDWGTDHAQLECIVELGSRRKVSWSFNEALQYNLNDKHLIH